MKEARSQHLLFFPVLRTAPHVHNKVLVHTYNVRTLQIYHFPQIRTRKKQQIDAPNAKIPINEEGVGELTHLYRHYRPHRTPHRKRHKKRS